MDLINLAVAAKAFSQHGLQDVSFERLIDVSQIVACLTSMYRVVSGDTQQKPPPGLLAAARQRQMSVPRCVDLVLNWLLNVYDRCVAFLPWIVGSSFVASIVGISFVASIVGSSFVASIVGLSLIHI